MADMSKQERAMRKAHQEWQDARRETDRIRGHYTVAIPAGGGAPKQPAKFWNGDAKAEIDRVDREEKAKWEAYQAAVMAWRAG
jgi:hypothetical protein